MRVLVFDGTVDEVHELVRHLTASGETRAVVLPQPEPAAGLTLERVLAAIYSDEHKALYAAIYASPVRRTLQCYVADRGLPERTAGGFVIAMTATARRLGYPLERILGRAAHPGDGLTLVWAPFAPTVNPTTPTGA